MSCHNPSLSSVVQWGGFHFNDLRSYLVGRSSTRPRCSVWASWLCRCSHGLSGAPFARFSDSATVLTERASRRIHRRRCLRPSLNVIHPVAAQLMPPRLWRFPASRSRFPGFPCRRSYMLMWSVTSSSYSASANCPHLDNIKSRGIMQQLIWR